MTDVYRLNSLRPDRQIIRQAADLLRNGQLVVFPTETVYGLGANGLDKNAVASIFAAKGRPVDNPLILHIAKPSDISTLVSEVTASANKLMQAFWPGPLTVVLPRNDLVPKIVSGGMDTVAIRMPDNNIALRLIEMSGVPVAAPSANTSGRPSPTTASMAMTDLAGKVAMVIDGGTCRVGLESTVVDCTGEIPALLRPGGITYEMLTAVVGKVLVAGRDDVLTGRSPGMKYRHYAPQAELKLLPDDDIGILTALGLEIEAGRRVGAIVSRETAQKIPRVVQTVIIGQQGDVHQYAAGLYSALRFFDFHEVDIIFAETVAEQGLGMAVMNRLKRAAEGD